MPFLVFLFSTIISVVSAYTLLSSQNVLLQPNSISDNKQSLAKEYFGKQVLEDQLSEITTIPDEDEKLVMSKSTTSLPIESPEPSEVPTRTPTLKPTLAVTLTPTANPSSTPTRVPTPSLVLQPQYTSEEIQGFIERFAGQYAVDPNALRHIADCESDFNPRAKNGDYLGLYQFSTNTWKNNRLLIGEDADPTLRLNAEEAVQTASFLLSIGKGGIWPNCLP